MVRLLLPGRPPPAAPANSFACTLVLEDAGEAGVEIFGNIKTCLVSDDRLAEWWGRDSRNDTT